MIVCTCGDSSDRHAHRGKRPEASYCTEPNCPCEKLTPRSALAVRDGIKHRRRPSSNASGVAAALAKTRGNVRAMRGAT